MTQTTTSTRLAGLDRLRGLAIVTMIVDHVALLAAAGAFTVVLRVTVGRVALPLFFLVAGALVRRVGWRHGAIAVVGVVLPYVVPWIDRPNVLVLYVAGAVVLVAGGRLWWWPWAVLVACLVLLANGWGAIGSGYPLAALLGLLAAGHLIGRHVLDGLGLRLPNWLAVVGRYPLSIYVGHLLILQTIVWGAS